ncbi:MAG: family 20 glycosylhydrolase [Gammaproteobacteria bacterium]|nr:family 20 glycosylhydrolase [Gammaproteobacteria bacterium]MBU1446714.1 family 20 glycosylhydrolase [Gammaproteobacteria bacterium]
MKSNANVRALHFVVSFGITPEQVKMVIDQASNQHFNTLILALCWRGSTKLISTPWAHGDRQWKKRELRDVAEYARSKGLSIIPEVKLLTHQEVFLQDSHPEWMYNTNEYDPRHKLIYGTIFAVLDELIDVLHPTAVHIGHDEVNAGITHNELSSDGNGAKQNGRRMLPADLFLMDVMLIHEHLKKRNVETWMWGDMLISPEEFPEMFARDLHGRTGGYGKLLRAQLPRDIVICDWHYVDEVPGFPSLSAMRQEGFRVIGATWRKHETIQNFSKYAAAHGAIGMMATTWFIPATKSGVVSNWHDLSQIIHASGEAFSRDFPDEK